ncbi:helix-turn-helix transcriptional regulator [Synechococcus sp. BO 8801]|uniref:helix-turn-helix domain-containing protein n=1 Tax=Synechococcus sp. BO 8801 TaxID=169670 RepID=UPI00117D7A26|nr:helix-turn-helix transcriptional regulator [Synechococcus sp. BO 8801]
MSSFLSDPSMERFTPADGLRTAREFRKLNIYELADASGVPVSSIAAFEAGEGDLLVEELRRLAVALEWHPSLIAFRSWPPYPLEPKAVIVNGLITTNGIPMAESFSCSLPWDGCLSLRSFQQSSRLPQRGGWIEIYPFTRALLKIHKTVWKSPTIMGSAHGDVLGEFGESFGEDQWDRREPPEDDIRLITELSWVITHSLDGIHFQFSGVADSAGGLVKSGRSDHSPKGCWDFIVSFQVALESLADFYGLSPQEAERMRERLKELRL